jgi:hypothetical protein
MAREGSVAPKERVNIVYRPAIGDAKEDVELPLKIMMMGDYTQRPDERPLEDRKPVSVDKDNFNENSGNHWYVAPGMKHFTLFVSIDGVGDQAEYMRTGMDFNVLKENARRFLRETKHSSISFINTFNLLSIPSLHKFMEMILELRQEFGGRAQTEHEINQSTCS